VQAGTRFIATTECAASGAYKEAIVAADEDDVVWTERLTGLPVAVLRTPWVERFGTRVHPVGRWLLRNRSMRRWARTVLALRALPALRVSVAAASDTEGYWQAGKSVARIVDIAPAGEIVADFEVAARTA
jgi:nitronate monooxygenase